MANTMETRFLLVGITITATVAGMPAFCVYIEGFYQICQSAVVFHDEFKKSAALPR